MSIFLAKMCVEVYVSLFTSRSNRVFSNIIFEKSVVETHFLVMVLCSRLGFSNCDPIEQQQQN
jgi:hypothetical protein